MNSNFFVTWIPSTAAGIIVVEQLAAIIMQDKGGRLEACSLFTAFYYVKLQVGPSGAEGIGGSTGPIAPTELIHDHDVRHCVSVG